MHILFLTDNFPPEVNAPASRTFEHAREWVKSGHLVTVVTSTPNFPRGKVFPGYQNRLWQSEWIDGIRVIRVWTYIAANAGFFWRILDYLSFMFAAVCAALFVRQVNIVVGTSPQFFTACAAFLVSRYKRIPFVFELRDLWPESITAVGAMKDSWIIKILECVELFLYRKAAVIVAVTNSFKSRLIQRGIDPAKLYVVTNGVDLSRFKRMPRDSGLARELGLDGCFVGGYIGTHGLAHGLETLLDAAEILKNNGLTDVRLLFLGDGANKKKLMADAERRELWNVVFVDSVPKSEVVRYWSLLDVSIIHLRKSKVFTTVIPSKIFEALGMGIPLLHGVPGESADIVEQMRVGVVFPPGNAQALCDGLTCLKEHEVFYKDVQGHCVQAAKEFDRKKLAADMVEILESARCC